ncbi:MAG: hypothetical protein ACOCZB_06515 [Spirochaetota bacterium]
MRRALWMVVLVGALVLSGCMPGGPLSYTEQDDAGNDSHEGAEVTNMEIGASLFGSATWVINGRFRDGDDWDHYLVYPVGQPTVTFASEHNGEPQKDGIPIKVEEYDNTDTLINEGHLNKSEGFTFEGQPDGNYWVVEVFAVSQSGYDSGEYTVTMTVQ